MLGRTGLPREEEGNAERAQVPLSLGGGRKFLIELECKWEGQGSWRVGRAGMGTKPTASPDSSSPMELGHALQVSGVWQAGSALHPAPPQGAKLKLSSHVSLQSVTHNTRFPQIGVQWGRLWGPKH